MIQRCIHCHKAFRILAYCKQAGDEDATSRQHRHRANKKKKVVSPSTGIVVSVTPPAAVSG